MAVLYAISTLADFWKFNQPYSMMALSRVRTSIHIRIALGKKPVVEGTLEGPNGRCGKGVNDIVGHFGAAPRNHAPLPSLFPFLTRTEFQTNLNLLA